jgi:hypothetical protein
VRTDFEARLGLVDEAPYQAISNGEDPQAARPREGVFAEPTSTVLELTGNIPRSVAALVNEHIMDFAPTVAA